MTDQAGTPAPDGIPAIEAWTAFVRDRAGDLPPDELARMLEALVAWFGLPVWTRDTWRRTDLPPAVRGEATDDAVAAARAHYRDDGDDLPPPIAELAARLPDLARVFVATRAELTSSTLDRPVRELLLCLLSAQAGYVDGALRHLRLAREAGLPLAALRDALVCVTLTHGASAWHAYGRRLWTAATAEG